MNVGQPEQPTVLMLCQEHEDWIAAGEPWYFDAADGLIYLGPDLAARPAGHRWRGDQREHRRQQP